MTGLDEKKMYYKRGNKLSIQAFRTPNPLKESTLHIPQAAAYMATTRNQSHFPMDVALSGTSPARRVHFRAVASSHQHHDIEFRQKDQMRTNRMLIP